jgi:hypothetical protein
MLASIFPKSIGSACRPSSVRFSEATNALDLTLAIRVPEIAEAFAEALESEGVDSATAASAVSELEAMVRSRLPVITEDSSGSSSSSTLASRISKTLDLQGATFSVDAACASSMATLEAACESLWAQDCDITLWGGGDRSMRVQRFEAPSQFDGLSRTERCVPLDASADGFLPGEGAVVCVLQRLSDASAMAVAFTRWSRESVQRATGAKAACRRLRAQLWRRRWSEPTHRVVWTHGAWGSRNVAGTGNPAGDGAELIALRQVLCAEGRTGRSSSVRSRRISVHHRRGSRGRGGRKGRARFAPRHRPTDDWSDSPARQHFGPDCRHQHGVRMERRLARAGRGQLDGNGRHSLSRGSGGRCEARSACGAGWRFVLPLPGPGIAVPRNAP